MDTSVPRTILILYGSETGNSEDAAGDIERMAMRLRFQTSLEEMNDVELSDLLRYSLVVFVIATTGQGDIPKNARKFWKSLLRKRLQPGCLSRVNFTTFGLGDSSYFQYNWAARKLHKRLTQLGAVEFLPRGEADERHEDGIDGTLLSWCHTLKTYLEKEYPLPQGVLPIPPDVQLPPKFTLELAASEPVVAPVDKPLSGSPSDHGTTKLSRGKDIPERLTILRGAVSKQPLDASVSAGESSPPVGLLPVPDSQYGLVTENKRVTPDSHWQDVRHVRILVPNTDDGSRLDYSPGDVAVIYPKNFPQDVQALIDLMGWGDVADKPFVHHNRQDLGSPNKVPRNCYPLENSTLRELLTHNYDITCIPRRSFFAQIACYTDEPTHKQRLSDFGNPLYTDEFYDYTSRPRRSTLEVLQDFPTVQIPYQHIPAVFPVIRGREYSIASGGQLKRDDRYPDATAIELLIALVRYKTVLRKTRHGLCSRYIGSLAPGTPISLAVRSNHDRRLADISMPLIAIAPGTGVAPIRALLHERNVLWEDHVKNNYASSSSSSADAETKTNRVIDGEDSSNNSTPAIIASTRPPTLLFYGSRNRTADFYFSDEYPSLGVDVITAFSRDDEEEQSQSQVKPSTTTTTTTTNKDIIITTTMKKKKKTYVQDRILENAARICALLRQSDKGAIICLCGSSGKMPEAVRKALYECLVKGGLAPDEESAREVLHRRFLFWEEVW
ncbi:riboflavin synthase domain-like protein [Xylariaceae sp. FL0594]|nr:riboflavin synthase domain-like protein [Xylariaceae sp. FL0594]